MTIKTVKSSGGDYTTLQAAINACPSDITAAGTNETWEIECYSSVTGSRDISISGKTTDATHYIRIYTPSGERHNGLTGGFSIEDANVVHGIDIANDHVRIEGIRFVHVTGGNGAIRISGAATRNVLIGECIVAGGLYPGIRISSVTGGTISVRNCVNVNTSGTYNDPLIYASSGSGYTVRAHNCTSYTSSTGTDDNRRQFWNVAGVTCVAVNCIAGHGASGNAAFTGTWSSSSYNTTTDASAPGTNATTSWSNVFTSSTDYRLTSEVAGTDLSGDANLPVTTDITGATRSGWSRGAFEYAPAAGTINLAGSATAGATGSATITVQRNLASAAVAGALASGGLSINKALTSSAIGAALGSATLSAFTKVWRVPTNAPNGTTVKIMIVSGTSPNYTIAQQGTAVVAGGYADLPTDGTPGTLSFAFMHNYNDNTATTSIYGGGYIATLTSI